MTSSSIGNRIRRLEAASTPEDTRFIRLVVDPKGSTEEERTAAEDRRAKIAELRASGFTGKIVEIVRLIVDPNT